MTKQTKHKHNEKKHQLYLLVGWVVLIVLAIIPFHTLLTTWAGSVFGAIDAWRIWKEILIFAAIPVGLYLLRYDPELRRWLFQGVFGRMIWAFVGLYIVSGIIALLVGNVEGDALLYAYFSNLRFLAFFVIAAAAARRVPWLRQRALTVTLIGGAVVVLFGLAQLLVLPYDALRFFGYGPDTIPAYQTVDDKLEYLRIQSTLRGANPFGAYLVVYISLLVVYASRCWRRWWYWLVVVAALTVLVFTYSRSAYMGVLLAGAVVILVRLPQALRKVALVVGLCMAVVATVSIVLLRDVDVVQNALFHTDESSRSATSSNENRLDALKVGATDMVTQPFGNGPGTAGPASTRNSIQTRIAENYFIQICQEVGWLGLGLLVGILLVAGLVLWRARSDPLALGLFAAFIGLTAVNMVSHAWADDTLGLLWWGLAGVVVGPLIAAESPFRVLHLHKWYEQTIKEKAKKRN